MRERVLDDVRYGARILTKSPGLSATAALLIALVIGGNATVFSMVNGIVRSPAPGITATDLVSFGQAERPGMPYHPFRDYQHYAAQSRTLQSLAAYGFRRAAVGTPVGTYLLNASPATENFFATIGIAPALGRVFTRADIQSRAPVAIISHRVWRDYFESARGVIGQTLQIDGAPYTVVGVTPPPFGGVVLSEEGEVWTPLDERRISADESVVMIGRLATGQSVANVRTEFATLQAQLDATLPDEQRSPLLITPYAAAAGSVFVAFQREVLAIFSIVTLLTLLVVCANVANLMLSRALAQQRETAVRQSLGASRLRIVRLMLVEGLAISMVACVAALVVAWSASGLIPALLPSSPLSLTFPTDFRPDWRVAAYAILLTLLGTVAFSLAPAIRTWRANVLPFLKDGAHTSTGGRSRVANALVVMQLAFSVLLLTSAGLVYRSAGLMAVDVGFETDRILLVGIGTGETVRTGTERLDVLDRIQSRLAALPGVSAVSYSTNTPASWTRDNVHSPALVEPLRVLVNTVGAGYLDTLGVALTAGRPLVAADRTASIRRGMVNERLAARLWPGQSALGQQLRLGREGRESRVVEIVGVVPDALYGGYNPERPDAAPGYVMLSDTPDVRYADGDVPAAATFLVRTGGDVNPVSALVPQALSDADPRAGLALRQTLASRFEEKTLSARMIASLLFIFAMMSLLIAAIGQYAVVAFSTRRRMRDFGIRLALGATGRQIVGAVLGEGTRLTLVGLLVGFVLSVGLATAVQGALYGVRPTDPRTYASVFVMLAAISLIASYLPARRASRIDPVQALRQE